jgi:hypothetical protein
MNRTDLNWADPIVKQYTMQKRRVDRVLELTKRKIRNALRSTYGITDENASKILNLREYQGRAFQTLKTA